MTSGQVEGSSEEQRADEVHQSSQRKVELYPCQTAYPMETLFEFVIGEKYSKCIRNLNKQ